MTFDEIEQLITAGRFRAAFQSLEALPLSVRAKDLNEVTRIELLERTGQHELCLTTASRLLKRRDISDGRRSVCEIALAAIERDRGNVTETRHRLERAISLAKSANDLEHQCIAELRLAALLADQTGPAASHSLFAVARADVIRLGNQHVSAALHLHIGEHEGKRGFLNSALRHTLTAQGLLESSPNAWLEGWAENNLLALAIVQSDFDDAAIHGDRGLVFCEESGCAHVMRACLANLGNLYYSTGQYERAAEYLLRSISFLPSSGEAGNATRESLARVLFAQGKLEECERLLTEIERGIQQASDGYMYVYRYSKLTHARLLSQTGDLNNALITADKVIELATRTEDRLLRTAAELTKAEVLFKSGRPKQGVALLGQMVLHLNDYPITIFGAYERAFGLAFLSDGKPAGAFNHLSRATRVVQGVRSAPDINEMQTLLESLPASQSIAVGVHDAPSAIQNIAALLLHAGRPELLATGLVAVLADTGSVTAATALARAKDGSAETLAAFEHTGDTRDAPSATEPHTISLGVARGRTIEVVLHPRPDLESAATLNAVTIVLGTVRELERAQAEREERLTLWPIEDVPLGDDQAIVNGHMRELMAFVRRIATTNVAVLVTGESGTGKEILARAIHSYSARAEKPFVPFNCTAVPRELLESQLFGHRRGAFTGADRDHPGLIRAAKDGTLFLDEIGELGLDLQPKLLRFLESGEINPLGEPSPFIVNVRIIAATNRDLEQLVREGRFREDLFYRLNVIRLNIPPLRERRDEIPALVQYFVLKATTEFSKGRVRVSEETMEHLLLYPWPGNVRQLQNELRRMIALADPDTVLTPKALSVEIRRATERRAARQHASSSEMAVPLDDKLNPTLAKIECEMIRVALRTHQGRVEAAAKALGISRKGLYLKRQRLGL